MQKNWKKEIARDIIALGSIPFYFIVMIRAIVGKYLPFVYHLGIALLVLIILSKIKSNQHIARGLALVVFTSFFYKATLYTIFAALLWIAMVFSLVYLKVKNKEIAMGIIFGITSVVISYFLTSLIV